MIKYSAFLRAINVGGKSLIEMNELKRIFESIGFWNVKTYIQSGNVMFESSITDENVIIKQIENLLHKNLSKDVVVFIRTFDQMKSIIEHDPFQKAKFKISTKPYITFFNDELKQKPELPYLSQKKDVEITKIKEREIYCIAHEINGSYGFPNVFIEKEFGVKATTRNWNTITKVVGMMQ